MFSRSDLLLPVLDAHAMREADRRTIEEWGVPGRVLMETAGRACADAAERLLPPGAAPEATVLAGRGNNGGDGLVVARVLHARSWTVRVVLCGEPATPDCAANRALLDRIAGDRLTILPPEADLGRASGVIVDAMLGIGARGDLREPVRSLAVWVNRQRPRAKILAVDLPSGLDADLGTAPEATVRADVTLAMGALKVGLLLGRGPALAGEVRVAEIGIPDSLLREDVAAWTAGPDWLEAVLPQREAHAHKYAAGTAACVVGSRAYTGAAVLATRAAARAGAGAVICLTPESARHTVDAHNTEVMVDAQPETAGGGVAYAALGAIRQRLDSADAALIGCGLGRDEETHRLVRELVASGSTPLVLDADGLGAFAGNAAPLAKAGRPLALTPHLGELRRLLGDADFEPGDRIATVRELAVRWNSTLLLKGMPSVIGTPEARTARASDADSASGDNSEPVKAPRAVPSRAITPEAGVVAIGPPGKRALATAGTGDVLAGTTAGLMAQGLSPEDAALAALHLGYRAACAYGGRPGSMLAGDLL